MNWISQEGNWGGEEKLFERVLHCSDVQDFRYSPPLIKGNLVGPFCMAKWPCQPGFDDL